MKVGIICPKGAKTGGPEALHQLFFSLRKAGAEAFLFSSEPERNTVREYDRYNPKWGEQKDLENADFLVVPETFRRLPKSIVRSFKGRYVKWWLSIDNASDSWARAYEERTNPIPKNWLIPNSTIGEIVRIVRKTPSILVGQLKQMNTRSFTPDLHIAQSVYAQTIVGRHFGGVVHLVSDYVDPTHSEENGSEPVAPPGSQTVCFNAAKGAKLVQRLKPHLNPSIVLVPLARMTRGEICAHLTKASLYLDLGHFPGRDRMPREAAKAGSPVLIAKRGAARYWADFPLPEFYTIDLSVSSPEEIAMRIEAICSNPLVAIDAQAQFRSWVAGDEERFDLEVRTWLGSL